MLLFCVRLEKSSGEDTAAPLSASTTVMRTTSLPGFQKFEDVPCPIPPPPPSMFPLPPDANAVAVTRQNTRARLHKRARSRFKYITLRSFLKIRRPPQPCDGLSGPYSVVGGQPPMLPTCLFRSPSLSPVDCCTSPGTTQPNTGSYTAPLPLLEPGAGSLLEV